MTILCKVMPVTIPTVGVLTMVMTALMMRIPPTKVTLSIKIHWYLARALLPRVSLGQALALTWLPALQTVRAMFRV